MQCDITNCNSKMHIALDNGVLVCHLTPHSSAYAWESFYYYQNEEKKKKVYIILTSTKRYFLALNI